MGKSTFLSKTFWGAISTLLAAIAPAGQALAAGNTPATPEIVEAVTALIGTAIAVYGRYTAEKTVFTPHWLPGRNEEDILSEPDLFGKLMRGKNDAESTWGPSKE